jgi:hypothetical protein
MRFHGVLYDHRPQKKSPMELCLLRVLEIRSVTK